MPVAELKPVVSVIIPTYNQRAMLAETIASVRAQDSVAWELLVIDDASTDDTPAYLASLREPAIRCFFLDRRGERSAARNHGLAQATGAYVMFLDHDDLLRPGALRLLSAALDAHPQAVAAVGARRDWFVVEGWSRRDVHPRFTRVGNLFDEFLFGWSAVSGQNLFRAALIRELGGYRSGSEPCEDRDLWLRVARRGPVVLCPAEVLTYRVHPAQWRPPELREIRERVARRAIRALPRTARRRGLLIRRGTALVDEAEDAARRGKFIQSAVAALRAALMLPRLFCSPLIGLWVARRIAGRVYHRLRGDTPPT